MQRTVRCRQCNKRAVAPLSFLSFFPFLSFSFRFRFPSRVCVLSPLLRVPSFRCLSFCLFSLFSFSPFPVPVHFSLRLADSYFFVSSKKCICRPVHHTPSPPLRSLAHCSCRSQTVDGVRARPRARTRCVGDTQSFPLSSLRARPLLPFRCTVVRRVSSKVSVRSRTSHPIPSSFLLPDVPRTDDGAPLFGTVCRSARLGVASFHSTMPLSKSLHWPLAPLSLEEAATFIIQ